MATNEKHAPDKTGNGVEEKPGGTEVPPVAGVDSDMSLSDSENITTPLPSRNRPDIPPMRRDNEGLSASISQGSRMSVGPGIELKGEISNCAALVVEGNVDGTLDGEALEVSQRGVFIGTVRVETAEIQGSRVILRSPGYYGSRTAGRSRAPCDMAVSRLSPAAS